MQIFVKTLTGNTITLSVEETTYIGPVRVHPASIRPPPTDLSAATILAGAGGVMAKAAAETMADFWASRNGLSVLHYVRRKPQSEGMSADLLDQLVTRLAVEFSRFFLLKAITQDIAAPIEQGCRYSPPSEVGEVWHAFLLFPAAYQGLCAAILGPGMLIDHDPRASYPELRHLQVQRYAATYERYVQLFGEAPPDEFWPVPESLWRPESFSSVKWKIYEKEQITVDQQRLIFAGKQLDDDRTLAECAIGPDSLLHVVLKLRGC